jgi:alpha-beta hydrolase superfamily lysophospholipase
LVDPLFRRVRTTRVSTPILVLGAADDGMVTNAEVRATAKAYNTEAEVFPDMGHNMMQEPGWAAVAQRIHGWLNTRELG